MSIAGSKYQDRDALQKVSKKKWKVMKFEDVFIDETSKATKIKKNDYLDIGAFPIIDQGKHYIAGYTNSNEGIYNNPPFIIFGDHTRVLKYVDFPIFIGADGVKLLKNRFSEDEVLTKFLYYFLLTIKIPDTGYNRHFKYLKETAIPIPDIDTQKKITKIIDKAQIVIDKRKAQIDALDQLTQSVFLEMFGEPFSNPFGWSKITIKDYIKKIKKVNLKQSQDIIKYIDISSIDNQKNVITSYTEYIGSDAPSRAQQIVQKGDILISTVRPNLKNIAIVQDDLDNLICSTGFCVIRCNENLNSDFVFHLVKTDSFTKNLVMKTTGANYPAVKNADIYNESIIYPPIKLQEKFSSIKREIDMKKTALEKSLISLENLFNSLLHRAFKGELFSEEQLNP